MMPINYIYKLIGVNNGDLNVLVYIQHICNILVAFSKFKIKETGHTNKIKT
jgi:hypothetical protein